MVEKPAQTVTKMPHSPSSKLPKAVLSNDPGNRQQATGNRQQATGNRQQANYTHLVKTVSTNQ